MAGIYYRSVILFFSAFLVYSCEEYTPVAAPCIKMWAVQNYQSISISSGGNALTFASASINPGPAGEINFNQFITGDFISTITLESFSPGTGDGTYLEFRAICPTSAPGSSIRISISNFSPQGPGLQVGIVMDPAGTDPTGINGTYRSITIPGGTFRLWRTGSDIQAVVFNSEQSFSQTVSYSSQPMALSIQFGSRSQTITGDPSARVRNFVLTRNGESISDSFSCNSLE